MSHHRETVTAAGAPAAVGPYSHAVKAGGLLFISGQIPLDPDSGELVGETPPEQARRCLENLSVIAAAGGCSLAEDSVKLTVYLTDMGRLPEYGRIRGEYIPGQPPASTAVRVTALAMAGLMIEVEATAVL